MRDEENVAVRCAQIFLKVIFLTPQDSMVPVYEMNSNSNSILSENSVTRPRVGVATDDNLGRPGLLLSVVQMVDVVETVAETLSLNLCHWLPVRPLLLSSRQSCAIDAPLSSLSNEVNQNDSRTSKVTQLLSGKLDSSAGCLLNGVSDLNYILSACE